LRPELASHRRDRAHGGHECRGAEEPQHGEQQCETGHSELYGRPTPCATLRRGVPRTGRTRCARGSGRPKRMARSAQSNRAQLQQASLASGRVSERVSYPSRHESRAAPPVRRDNRRGPDHRAHLPTQRFFIVTVGANSRQAARPIPKHVMRPENVTPWIKANVPHTTAWQEIEHDGISKGTPASRIFVFARTSRCDIVAGATRNAPAMRAPSSPSTVCSMRGVRAASSIAGLLARGAAADHSEEHSANYASHHETG